MYGYVKETMVEVMREKGLDVISMAVLTEESKFDIFVRNGNVTDIYHNLNLKLNNEELSKHLETHSGTSFLLADTNSRFVNHTYVGDEINNARCLMYLTPSPLVIKANDKRMVYSAEILDSEDTLDRVFDTLPSEAEGGGVVCEYVYSNYRVRCVMLNGKVVFGYKCEMASDHWKHLDGEGYLRHLHDIEEEILTEIAQELQSRIGLNCGIVDLLLNDNNEFLILSISEEILLDTELLMWFSSKKRIREMFGEMVDGIVKSNNPTVRLDNKHVTAETLNKEVGSALPDDIHEDVEVILEDTKENIEVS